MNAAEITKVFEPWRARHSRTAWKPVVETNNCIGPLSWFGGEPTRSIADQWPVCQHCHAPMRFLLQLAFAELPKGAGLGITEGVLQLFYCSTDDGSCETWAPFSGTHSIQVIPSGAGLASSPNGIQALPKATVINWQEVQDSPHPEEHESLGLLYKYDFKNNLVHVHSGEPALELHDLDIDLNVAEAISNSTPGDKLRGWPYWIQSVEYPRCSDCGTPMELLLQVDSEDNLDYMFGDAGCAHLTYCSRHPEVFAFGWACG